MSALPVGISYSMGTSSEWLIQAVIEGEIERPEHLAVFNADTHDEHIWSYERVERVRERCAAAGIPFFQGSHRTALFTDVNEAANGNRKRVDTPPFWTENQGGSRGQLTQQCSQIYKTAVVRRMQSAWLKSLGLPKRIVTWLGFAHDEQIRATKALARNEVKWASLDFPAIRMGAPRGQQRHELTKWTGSAPRFSMCRRCPYKTPERWRQTSEEDLPEVFDTDERIRHGLENVGIENPVFITDRLIPVEQLIRKGDPQPDLPGLESYCDGGACFL